MCACAASDSTPSRESILFSECIRPPFEAYRTNRTTSVQISVSSAIVQQSSAVSAHLTHSHIQRHVNPPAPAVYFDLNNCLGSMESASEGKKELSCMVHRGIIWKYYLDPFFRWRPQSRGWQKTATPTTALSHSNDDIEKCNKLSKACVTWKRT